MFCLISDRLGMGRRGSVRAETYLDEIVSCEMCEPLEDEENAKRADKFARLKEHQKMQGIERRESRDSHMVRSNR